MEEETEERVNLEESQSDEGVELDLSLGLIGSDGGRSVTDGTNLPLFTGRFVLAQRRPPVSMEDVFTTEISRGRREIANEEALFQEPMIMERTLNIAEEDGTDTLVLVFSFILLGLVTVMAMNLYLKKKRKVTKG